MSYAVTGGTAIAAADTSSAVLIVTGAGVPNLAISTTQIVTGLAAGTNTFTAKYKVSASTGTFTNRSITVQGIA